VPVKSTVLFTEALDAVGVEEERAVYWAGRATLVPRHEDVGVYDRVFRSFWRQEHGAAPQTVAVPVTIALDDGAADADGAARDEPVDDMEVVVVRYSPTEILRRKDFAAYSDEELAEAQRLMADITLAGALRRSRRLRPSRRTRGSPDIRRTMQATLRTHGE